MKASLLQLFALDKNGRVQSVNDVSRGMSCECYCPCCGSSVIARQGDVREWHFAHSLGADCEHAAETALHLAAKQIIVESGGFTIPQRKLTSQLYLPDGRSGFGEVLRPEMWIDFDSVESEKQVGMIRPDIVAMLGNLAIGIEVAVTHFVGDEKKDALIQLGMPTVEIDLSDMKFNELNWETLKEIVINSTESKYWIVMMDKVSLENEAHQLALDNAYEKPLFAQKVKLNPKDNKERFYINRKMVHLNELPFGISIWTPYDPNINEIIKSLARRGGGKWQPKYKNWLFPIKVKSWLHSELTKLSGKYSFVK